MSDPRSEILEVFARYTRAVDRRDGKVFVTLFTPDAAVLQSVKTGSDGYEPLGEPMVGSENIAYAVENFMYKHTDLTSSHHITLDHIVDVDGDNAHMNAQYIAFATVAAARPADGWPEGAFGVQGTVTATESGYYDTDFRRIDGAWKIVRHHVLLDLPYPGQS